MDPVLETVNQYIDRHRRGVLPSQNRPRTPEDSIRDPRPKFSQGIRYFTFLEDRCFGIDEQIHLTIDQITEVDKARHILVRQKLMHNHEFFEIFYVYSGRCISTINGEDREFSEGDICLYTPNAIHCMQTPEEGDVVINLLIRKSLFDETFLNLVRNNDLVTGFFIDSLYNTNSRQRHIVFHKNQATIARPIILQMFYEQLKHDGFSQNILRSYLVCLFSDLARSYTQSLTEAPALNGKQLDMKEVISYIERHYKTLTIEELAAAFGYSVRSMSGFICSKTGKTFRDTIKSFRLRNASRLLCETDLPLDAIAFEVGYTQRCSLERAFKNNFHISPAEYRRRYRNERRPTSRPIS